MRKRPSNSLGSDCEPLRRRSSDLRGDACLDHRKRSAQSRRSGPCVSSPRCRGSQRNRLQARPAGLAAPHDGVVPLDLASGHLASWPLPWRWAQTGKLDHGTRRNAAHGIQDDSRCPSQAIRSRPIRVHGPCVHRQRITGQAAHDTAYAKRPPRHGLRDTLDATGFPRHGSQARFDHRDTTSAQAIAA